MSRKKTVSDEPLKRLDEFELKERRRKRRKKPKKENNFFGYLASIVFNGALLYTVNHLLVWNVPFLAFSFQKVLPMANFAIGAALFSNFLLMLDDEGKFASFLRIIQKLFGIFFVYGLLSVFPFNLSIVSNSALITASLKLALLSYIVGLGVGTMIEFLKLAFEK